MPCSYQVTPKILEAAAGDTTLSGQTSRSTAIYQGQLPPIRNLIGRVGHTATTLIHLNSEAISKSNSIRPGRLHPGASAIPHTANHLPRANPRPRRAHAADPKRYARPLPSEIRYQQAGSPLKPFPEISSAAADGNHLPSVTWNHVLQVSRWPSAKRTT